MSDEPRVRRVVFEGDPSEQDYLDAQVEVESIRSELSRIRGRLEELGRIETEFWFDSISNKVAGSLTLGIMGLYELQDGKRSFAAKAQRRRELWEAIAADPDAFSVESGKSKDWMKR